MREAQGHFSNHSEFDITANPYSAGKEKQFQAFSAFYILNNFDELVIEQLDGIVTIAAKNRGALNNTKYAKETGRVSTVYWAADTHEAKNIENFTSNLAKFIVTNIPRVDLVSNVFQNQPTKYKQRGQQYLTTKDLFMLAGALKQAEFEYNIIHQFDDGFEPIVFEQSPKTAMRRLLTDTKIPSLQLADQSLLNSFRAFLYEGNGNEQAVADIFDKYTKQLGKEALDIESLIAFEVNKNVAPTYIEYDSHGTASLVNYSKSFQASNRVTEGLYATLFFEAINPSGYFTAKNLQQVKNTPWQQLLNSKEPNLFTYFCASALGIEDVSLPMCYEFLEENKNYIFEILENAIKVLKNSELTNLAKATIIDEAKLYKTLDQEIDRQITSNRQTWFEFKTKGNQNIQIQYETC